MAIEKAAAHLTKFGAQDKIREFDVSSATVELAAAAIGCESSRIAKSITFSVADAPVLIVTSGDAKIDNRRFKERFRTKAKMLSPDEVETQIGHSVGGVCPFGVNAGVQVYLDNSLRRFDTVFPACGSANSVVELTIAELEQYSDFVDWVDVCKAWRSDDE